MLAFNFTPFPELKTKNLMLREIKVEDVNEIFMLRSDLQVMKYIAKKPAENIDEASEFIKRILAAEAENQSITWAITIKGNDKMIGTICLWNLQPGNYRGEIGYVLSPIHHGKSIMTEAIKAVTNYGFSVMNLHCIEGHVNPDNIASAKVLEKNNFTREAVLQENQYYDGRFYDTAIYTLFKRDWKGVAKP